VIPQRQSRYSNCEKPEISQKPGCGGSECTVSTKPKGGKVISEKAWMVELPEPKPFAGMLFFHRLLYVGAATKMHYPTAEEIAAKKW